MEFKEVRCNEAGEPWRWIAVAQISLIDNVPDDQLRFQGYTDTGFTVNGASYEGSLLCVGNLLMSWSPKNFSEISSESLSIFQIVRPIPEILILGTGRYHQQVDPELRRLVCSFGRDETRSG